MLAPQWKICHHWPLDSFGWSGAGSVFIRAVISVKVLALKVYPC